MRDDDGDRRHFALAQYDVLQSGPEEDFEQLVELVCLVFSTPLAVITLLDGRTHRIKSQRGWPSGQATLDCAFLDQTVLADEPLVIEDTDHDRRFATPPGPPGSPPVRSFLGAALCAPDGTRIGAIAAIDTLPRDFSPLDAEIIAQLARIAVTNLELRLIATKDAASGAESRRSFMDCIGRELERHKRTGQPSTVLVCHIGALGRKAGIGGEANMDAVIATVVRQMRRHMRKTDTLGRVGYRSLALLLADAGTGAAEAAVARLQTALQAVETPGFGVSFGHASADVSVASAAEWIAAADRAAAATATGHRVHDRVAATHMGVGNRWMN